MHDFPPFFAPSFLPAAPGLLSVIIPLFILVMLWTIVLKGLALWHAARANQKYWFVALLVINTIGILEIIYLIWFRPKSSPLIPARDSSPQE